MTNDCKKFVDYIFAGSRILASGSVILIVHPNHSPKLITMKNGEYVLKKLKFESSSQREKWKERVAYKMWSG